MPTNIDNFTYTGTLAETFPAEIDGTVLIKFDK
jgi:hypothetical protein